MLKSDCFRKPLPVEEEINFPVYSSGVNKNLDFNIYECKLDKSADNVLEINDIELGVINKEIYISNKSEWTIRSKFPLRFHYEGSPNLQFDEDKITNGDFWIITTLNNDANSGFLYNTNGNLTEKWINYYIPETKIAKDGNLIEVNYDVVGSLLGFYIGGVRQ